MPRMRKGWGRKTSSISVIGTLTCSRASQDSVDTSLSARTWLLCLKEDATGSWNPARPGNTASSRRVSCEGGNQGAEFTAVSQNPKAQGIEALSASRAMTYEDSVRGPRFESWALLFVLENAVAEEKRLSGLDRWSWERIISGAGTLGTPVKCLTEERLDGRSNVWVLRHLRFDNLRCAIGCWCDLVVGVAIRHAP